MKKGLIMLALACVCVCAQARTRYVGGDISALPMYEKYNSAYKDPKGNAINDLLTWFVESCGWNTFRVRIFVHPNKKDHDGTTNPTVCQDLEYVKNLGKRIKDAGAYFILDFHYSDTLGGRYAFPSSGSMERCVGRSDGRQPQRIHPYGTSDAEGSGGNSRFRAGR